MYKKLQNDQISLYTEVIWGGVENIVIDVLTARWRSTEINQTRGRSKISQSFFVAVAWSATANRACKILWRQRELPESCLRVSTATSVFINTLSSICNEPSLYFVLMAALTPRKRSECDLLCTPEDMWRSMRVLPLTWEKEISWARFNNSWAR